MTDTRTHARDEKKLSGYDRMSKERKVTLVFDEDVSVFKGNPFKDIETPYGKPVTISRGDICALADSLEEICHAFFEAIEGTRAERDCADALELYRKMFTA